MRNPTYSLITGLFLFAIGCSSSANPPPPPTTDDPPTPTSCTTCDTNNDSSSHIDLSFPTTNPEPRDMAVVERDFSQPRTFDLSTGIKPDMTEPPPSYVPPATCWSYSFLDYLEEGQCEQSVSGIWYQCSEQGTWVAVWDDGYGDYFGPDGYCSFYYYFY